jgi:hypothetical protein
VAARANPDTADRDFAESAVAVGHFVGIAANSVNGSAVPSGLVAQDWLGAADI